MIIQDIEKAIKIIESCTTVEQLNSAIVYVSLLITKHKKGKYSRWSRTIEKYWYVFKCGHVCVNGHTVNIDSENMEKTKNSMVSLLRFSEKGVANVN